MGDLKSGYLNSFGAFLTHDMSRMQLTNFVAAKSLHDVYVVYHNDSSQGHQIFSKKVDEFDALNVKLIDLYSHHLENLAKLLPAEQQKLIQNLKPLTEVLYWRRKPSK